MSLLHHDPRQEPLAELSCFRGEFYSCLTARSDALFELADAVLCGDGPVRSLAELSLVGEHRRGHGGLYAAVARGGIDVRQLRRALAQVPLPRAVDGRLVLAVDVTCWLRPDAHTSPQRILCHTYGRGKDQHIPVPGWPYSIVCALEPGRSSWTAPLDVLRLAPGDDTATVTARQLRDLRQRLIAAGQWQAGDPDILIVADAGYDAPRLGFLLRDLPVQVLARMRSDRVLRKAVPPRQPHTLGRPPRHGGEFVFGQPDTWGTRLRCYRWSGLCGKTAYFSAPTAGAQMKGQSCVDQQGAGSRGRLGIALRQILITRTPVPHSIRRSSGSDVRMVTGEGEAIAVAATIASRAYLWPWKPAEARSLLARRAMISSGGMTLMRETV